MVGHSLENKLNVFRKHEEHKPILGLKIPYLLAIGALIYLGNQTCPNIAFTINLLARYNAEPTIRNWNSIKHIFITFVVLLTWNYTSHMMPHMILCAM